MPEDNTTPTIGWVPAWADLEGRGAESADAGFVVGPGQAAEGQEYVARWTGQEAEELAAKATGDVARVTLLCADAGGAGGLALGGLTRTSERVLLAAPTAELNTEVELPENSQVALAPMETYDAVEITVFDRPVARGRIQVRDDFAAVAITEVPEGPEREAFERSLFAAMAEEAFVHGAEYLHMVVGLETAGHYQESGWTEAGRLIGFEKN